MAYDLASGLHRKLTAPMHEMLGSSKIFLLNAAQHLGMFRYAWLIPYALIALVCGLYFFKFWLSLPKQTRRIFLISAVSLLTGAIVFELFEGSYTSIHGEHNFTYVMLATIDKSLQMGGIIYFIYGQLEYIAETYKNVSLQFE